MEDLQAISYPNICSPAVHSIPIVWGKNKENPEIASFWAMQDEWKAVRGFRREVILDLSTRPSMISV